MIRLFRQWAACRRLNKLVRQRASSFEIQDYRKRREAALKCQGALTSMGGIEQSQWAIELPFPPATLSGHHNAHWRKLQPVKKLHRELAWAATISDKPSVPESGDIPISVTFYPPDNRGDRTNYPNRMKPYFDGIADALGVNDRRFLPSFHFAQNTPGGKVLVEL